MVQVMAVSHVEQHGACEISVLYIVGDTCTNNEDLNGTVFGQFRCPLNGFPYEAKRCCGEYGQQFCCIPERSRSLSEREHARRNRMSLYYTIAV